MLDIAYFLFREKCYASAMVVYSWINFKNKNGIYDANTIICTGRLNNLSRSVSLQKSFELARIEQFYILNLSRRTERRKRMEFEFNRVGIRPHFFSAFDSDSSLDIPKVVNNLSASTSMSKSFDGHLTHSHLSAVVNAMTPGAVAYKLSQRAIFQDALDKGYERICVFDDDVFFADFSSHRLCKFLTQSNFCWKIVALGASDNSIEIRLSQDTAIKALDEAGFYSPIPGKTCGSFAMMYERSVFQEIIEGCDEAVGTFDNSIIGALYARYPESCFVMFPNIVSPCVEESDIRASRVQSVQSRRMFWDIRNFKRWVEGGVV